MENYIGEIRIFGGTYAPADWNFCNGQLVQIAEYEALFQLIGTTYGGDGQTTFALPNMQSRVPVGMGTAVTGTPYVIGQTLGVENVTLASTQLPVHQHTLQASISAVTNGTAQASPSQAYFGDKGGDNYATTAGTSTLASDALTGTMTPAGSSLPHNNIQPVLALQYIIAMTGIYPSQQ